MIFFPYSTALTLANPPRATYATFALCLLVFWFQLTSGITEQIMYYPQSWNPLTMITSSFAHGGPLHLAWNMIFFMAFAPALEALIGNTWRYIWIMLFISFVVGISYSLFIALGLQKPLPSLGFSGVVMGFIGLSAYMMPQARIRCFWWFIVFWKTIYLRAWILAIVYIGMDAWKLVTAEDFNGVNLVAHVAGGIAGYAYGYFWLRERKAEVADELDEEIEEMKLEQRHGRDRAMAFRGRKKLDREIAERKQRQADDRFMSRVYKEVSVKRDHVAIALLMERFDLDHLSSGEIEALYNRVKDWGPSRTLLCLGRLIIYSLDQEKRHGRALYFIELCQQINPQFLLPDLSRTTFFAQAAVEAEKINMAKNLLANPTKRYARYVDIDAVQVLAKRIRALQQI